MYKKKFLFISFEGIEGSGKSYQSKKLYKKLRKMNIPTLLTREPGGTKSAELIREIILKDYFRTKSIEKFDKYTDTLLYLAARNEHVKNKLKNAALKKKIIICDRFTDSTLAYQVFGKGVNINLINTVHKYILGNITPSLTFILKVNINKALKRLNIRGKKNRYDKFSRNFYNNVQKAFIKISKSNKNRYVVLDNSRDSNDIEKIILNKVLSRLKK